MSKEKQILQLRAKDYSQRRIADTLMVSKNTLTSTVLPCILNINLDMHGYGL